MTAEILVMNKYAISMAADSAATISSFNGEKIFNSSEKIFNLIPGQPVGAMIFNRAEFMGVPWEIIIKKFRDAHQTKEFASIKDIVDIFFEFLKNTFTSEDEVRFLGVESDNICSEIIEHISDKLYSGISDEEKEQTIQDVIDEYYLIWSQSEQHISVDRVKFEKLEFKYSEYIISIILQRFDGVSITQELVDKIRDIILLKITRLSYQPYNSIVTGIVIAGYGNDDLFPSSYAFVLSGKLNGELISNCYMTKNIDYKNTAHIAGYAQHDEVIAFLAGRHPDYKDEIDSIFKELFFNYPKRIVDRISSDLSEINIHLNEDIINRLSVLIQEKGEKEYSSYREYINKFERVRFVGEILQVVTHLPKDELGIAAETFVNLTSFKRKITPGSQTVGGPIDVAIISKKDGFVWVKRKHYFSKELNPHKF